MTQLAIGLIGAGAIGLIALGFAATRNSRT
jgi:hypothetical protein